jgi:hypothetical protein
MQSHTNGLIKEKYYRPKPKQGIPMQKEEIKLENKLRDLLGHDQVKVHPSGAHLLIKLIEDGKPETIARLTRVRPNFYVAAFKTHKGRWEPLPAEGDLLEVAEIVIDMLRPYFDINRF